MADIVNETYCRDSVPALNEPRAYARARKIASQLITRRVGADLAREISRPPEKGKDRCDVGGGAANTSSNRPAVETHDV
jgi:hypothetical protein